MESNKTCTKCKEIKTYDNFTKDKTREDGHFPQCKKCTKEYRSKIKEKTSNYNKMYWENNKEAQKQRIASWRKENADYIKKYRKDNKERDSKKAREWYETEKGKHLTNMKTLRYRSKKRKLRSDFTIDQWLDCMKEFHNTCAYCGIDDNKTLAQEHFVPVMNNGPYTKSNIVPSCISCNSSKSDKDFFEWYPSNENYSYERMIKILYYLGIDKNNIYIEHKN